MSEITRALIARVGVDLAKRVIQVQRAFDHWRELDAHLLWCDRQIGQHVRTFPARSTCP